MILVCVNAASAAVEYSITDLGTLGGNDSIATGINSSGQVVGDSYTSSGAEHAFLYSNGQMTDLGTLPSPYSGESFAGKINDAGQIVGVSENPSTGARQGFLYSNGSIASLSNTTIALPQAINNQGLIGGVLQLQEFGGDSFLYSNGVLNDIGNFGEPASAVVGINNNGTALISNTTGGPFEDVMLYKNGNVDDLGDFSQYGLSGVAFSAINDNNQLTLTTLINGTQHTYLYSQGSLTPLGSLGGRLGAQSLALNDSGQIVGQSQASGGGDVAFLYENGVMIDLNSAIDPSTGWELTGAMAINDAGQIAGSGYNPSGEIDAFLLTPLPEPGVSAALAISVSGLLTRRRRKCFRHAASAN
jgi:probable HAF family extracellular repeat protein